MVENHSDSEREETRCRHYIGYSLFYMHYPTNDKSLNINYTIYTKEGNVFFNAIMVIWRWTRVKDHSKSASGPPLLYFMGYSFRLAARDLLHAPSHRQDHSLCYTVEHLMERKIAEFFKKLDLFVNLLET